MELSDLILGTGVVVDPSSSINNVRLGDRVKIAKFCSVYGGKGNLIEIGADTYIGMFSILNGYTARLTIGNNVSIAQNVNVMTDSGPNASPLLQTMFPVVRGPVTIGNHAWLGAGCIIMPNVSLGECCVVAANSFVNCSFPPFCVIGGNPARLIKMLPSAITSGEPRSMAPSTS